MLGPQERSVLDRVAAEVFDAPVIDRWAEEFFADPRHHLAVAFDGEVVVGMASAVHYVHPDKPPELWINEVGVAPSHQGVGIGRRIMARLLDHGRALGCVAAWVLTEEDNTAARRLYASSGGTDDRTVIYTFDLGSG